MKIDVDAVARLRALCKEAGTQREAAKRLGYSEPHIVDLLRGRRRFSDAALARLGLRRTVIEIKA